jgi:hypothetical protein
MPITQNAHLHDPMEAFIIAEKDEEELQSEGHSASIETITNLNWPAHPYGIDSEGRLKLLSEVDPSIHEAVEIISG